MLRYSQTKLPADYQIDKVYTRARISATFIKKSPIGRQSWLDACLQHKLPATMPSTPVSTRMAYKVEFFTDLLEHRSIHETVFRNDAAKRISGVQWDVIQTIVDSPRAVKQCLMNQARGYFLISDAAVAALEAVRLSDREHPVLE